MLPIAVAVARRHVARADEADRRRASIDRRLERLTVDPAWIEPEDPRVAEAMERLRGEEPPPLLAQVVLLGLLAVTVVVAAAALASIAPVNL